MDPLVLPDLRDRVCLVTGANTGIGLVTARELARAGAHVFLGCRSPERAEAALGAIRAAAPEARVEALAMDLGSLASTRDAARRFLDRGLPLHVLVANAGLAGPRGLTGDGFELAFGTNHLGHYLLARSLLDRLVASAPARVVTVSSKSHYQARGIDWDAVRRPTRSVTGLPEYEVSKLANVLFSAELARRSDPAKLTTYALHPGVIASDIWRRVPWPLRGLMKLFMITTEEGARTTLHCATAPALQAETGRYYDACREKKPSAPARDPALARELWERSEAWVAGFLR